MEVSVHSLLPLLQDFLEVVGRESATDSDNLLRKIFEERIPRVADDNDKSPLPSPEEDVHSSVVNELFEVLNSKKIFGRNNEKEQILSQLFDLHREEIHLSWIPIFGVPGIGKTTLARLVYEEEVVQKHFELRVWVKVIGQELGLPDIARGILKSATGMTCPLDDLEELDEMVRDTFQSHTCLIVLDEIEVLDMKTWLHMKHAWFNVVGLGSVVLITTSNKEVANFVSEKPFELEKLSLEAGLSLYESLAFNSLGVLMQTNIFQGTPLFLKLLGCLLRFEEKISELLSSKEFLNSIMSFLDVSVVTLLSIWALPPNLLQCFAYCAIFPREYPLNKVNIIRLWIAEGFVEQYPGNKKLEDIGEAYFRYLLCRSFFTDIMCNDYGEIVEFRMPGLIHKLAQDVARVVFNEKVGFLLSIPEDAEDQLSLSLPFTLESDSRRLQTLISFSTIIFPSRLDLPLRDFEHLKTLDLSCSGIQEVSGEIGVLYKLNYLNLSYTLIESLPDSIVDLMCLQTLNLSGCYCLRVLPNKMSKLRSLRHLDLWLCDSLSFLPSGIGDLTSLKSLPLFVLGNDPDCSSLRDLHRLNQLKGRLEIKNLEHVKGSDEAQDAALYRKHIRHLGLWWSWKAENCYEVLECLRPNRELKVLELTGCMSMLFPSWLESIRSLIKISVTDCEWERLPPLGHLPYLKELQIKGMPNLQYIGREFYGYNSTHIFPSLEQLGLYDMPNLKWWSSIVTDTFASSDSSEFRNLITVTIEGCSQLRRIPSFPILSELVVCNSNNHILSSLNSLKSLKSLIINDMKVGRHYFQHLNHSVKKLIILHEKDINEFLIYQLYPFRALEHLGILHCLELNILDLLQFKFLQKLTIGHCQNLRIITILSKKDSLNELVIEDCPWLVDIRIKSHHLRSLIIKRCPRCFVPRLNSKTLPQLEYLLITGCPQFELIFHRDSSQISHVSCVILGKHKLETQLPRKKRFEKDPDYPQDLYQFPKFGWSVSSDLYV